MKPITPGPGPLGPGYYDIPAERYHDDPTETPSLSAGACETLLSATPLHCWTNSSRLNPNFEREDKTQFDIGSAAHELLTGKGKGVMVIPFDDYKKKEAQDRRDEAREMGYTPLTIPQDKQVREMVRRARLQLRAHGIGDVFEVGENEMTLIWESGGAINRIMVDCLDRQNRVAYDLKTAAGLAEPEAWVNTAMGMGIDTRAAFYLEGLETVLGGSWRYRYVPLEKKPPHCLSVIELGPQALEMGRQKVQRARAMWVRCLSANDWPAWSAEIAQVEPRAYHEGKWLERVSREEDHRARTGQDILDAAMRWQAPHNPHQKGA